MFENFSEKYIEGNVWSDFSHLIGQSIQYEADDGSITIGVVQSVSVGDIWEEEMVTPVGAFLDVYAEIGQRLVCVGLVNLFGHGWTTQQIRTVTDSLEVHGFESVTTPICRWYHNPNECEDIECPLHGIEAMPFRWRGE